MKAHPSTPCSSYLSSAPLTICTYTIWGSSGPNKSHVLITFEGVMTSGPQPIFIWFTSNGQGTGYASDMLQLSCPLPAWCAFILEGSRWLCAFPGTSILPISILEGHNRLTITFMFLLIANLLRTFRWMGICPHLCYRCSCESSHSDSNLSLHL